MTTPARPPEGQYPSDAELAERYGVPLEKVQAMQFTPRQREQIVGMRLSTKAERARMPVGLLMVTFDHDGERSVMTRWTSGGGTAEDPNWRGAPGRLGLRIASQSKDPRAAAGDHIAHRVNIACPHCGAVVSELHEFAEGILFRRLQPRRSWGIVDWERGRFGAGCRKCFEDGDEFDVDMGVIERALERSARDGKRITVKTGFRPETRR